MSWEGEIHSDDTCTDAVARDGVLANHCARSLTCRPLHGFRDAETEHVDA